MKLVTKDQIDALDEALLVYAYKQIPPISFEEAWELFEQGRIQIAQDELGMVGFQRTIGAKRFELARKHKRMAKVISEARSQLPSKE
ncbi:hypothetical protein N6L27_21535 [Leisingera sp. SS27]|uniref:hypothetical protein n=1 Tax=Leisingera sp. SS27 TaxID=2979462 RepID=UPI00232F1636|nr:hypothetical protein [Leisingera sp. SS27]MDC0660595.1 hypothetical protein [Leisingera sp. SS27]